MNRLDVVRAVFQAAMRWPERVYQKSESNDCQYTPDAANPQGCLVNAGLQKLNVDLEVLGVPNGSASEVMETLEEMRWLDATDTVTSEDEIRFDAWLDGVQGSQDLGHTWADAVKKADEVWPNVKEMREATA